MLYWQSTRAVAHRMHAFPKGGKASLMAFSEPCGLDRQDHPYKLISVEDTRFLHCNIKTLNLIPNCMAMQQAVEAGCDEVVFHRGDRVTEGAHSGLAILKDGVFCTPPADNLILPSITRKHFLTLCDKLGVLSGAVGDLPSAYFSRPSMRSLPFATEFDEAIKTRLFKGEGENLLVPVHRVVAEYLAAKWLARCVSSGQSARRVVALLRQGGSVPTSLRAVNAWLAGFSPELGMTCVSDDPYGVLRYGDVDGLPLPTARALLRALAALSHEDPFFRVEDWSRQSARGPRPGRIEGRIARAPERAWRTPYAWCPADRGDAGYRTRHASPERIARDASRSEAIVPSARTTLAILNERGAVTAGRSS